MCCLASFRVAHFFSLVRQNGKSYLLQPAVGIDPHCTKRLTTDSLLLCCFVNPVSGNAAQETTPATSCTATGMVTQEQLDLASTSLCLPLVLIMDFSLFQYLLTTFHRRHVEPRVKLLLFVAFVSFASLVPFAYPNDELIRDLNDISETCSVMTFFIQIGILTRDVNKKMRVRSLVLLSLLGDLLALVGIVVLSCNLVDIAVPVIEMDAVEHLDESLEGASLVFIFGFRFYFLAMAKGVRKVLQTQKTEIGFYLLFVTREYPFMIMEHVTGLPSSASDNVNLSL
ncbi:hypothetical protein FI667_g9905, partial [Globisporangium splendens]